MYLNVFYISLNIDDNNHTLTYEELSTVVCRIESLLNSKPLTPSSDSGDLENLTTDHFLTGQPILCVPEPNF